MQHLGHHRDEDGFWVRDASGRLVIHEDKRGDYRVRRYRPRNRGLFACIERWTRDDGDVHWRSISRDNVLSIYGRDGNSRIFDPSGPDPEHPRRVFTWLICETRDDRGNAIVYEYRPEDGADVDLRQAHERNRGERSHPGRTANRKAPRSRSTCRARPVFPAGKSARRGQPRCAVERLPSPPRRERQSSRLGAPTGCRVRPFSAPHGRTARAM
jgi:hypothetical protein